MKIRWCKVRAVSRMRQKFGSIEFSELHLRLCGSMRWGVVLLQQDPFSVDRSTLRTFGPVGQNRVQHQWLNCLAPAQSGLHLQNSTEHTALPSWRTYLVWPQVSPLDEDQTIDFVCQDLK
jgi:hypothetical protein